MSFLSALRVSGELSQHWKQYPEVRVILYEEGDGDRVRGPGGHWVRLPREVIVWRGGVMDPEWRPELGRRAKERVNRQSAHVFAWPMRR